MVVYYLTCIAILTDDSVAVETLCLPGKRQWKLLFCETIKREIDDFVFERIYRACAPRPKEIIT